MLRTRLRRSRPLTITERAIAAVTVALALGAVALSITGSAGASAGGQLPVDGPYTQGPYSSVSHAESTPLEIDQGIGE